MSIFSLLCLFPILVSDFINLSLNCKLLFINFFFCEYFSLEAHPISIKGIDKHTSKFIDIDVINESNYYKNLLVKKDNFKKFIDKI